MRAGIALGSNLGDRRAGLETAIAAIREFADAPVLVSSFHETAPVDCPPDSPAFLNAAMEIGWSGTPLELLDRLQGIERAHHRPDLRQKNVPRTLDLDLLYCDDLLWNDERLVLPHPLMTSRAFVLAPLAEIVPDRILPGCTNSVSGLFSRLTDEDATA